MKITLILAWLAVPVLGYTLNQEMSIEEITKDMSPTVKIMAYYSGLLITLFTAVVLTLWRVVMKNIIGGVLKTQQQLVNNQTEIINLLNRLIGKKSR